MKKFGKKLLTFVMTFAMVAGVWGGMGINVRADGRIIKANELKEGELLYAGDIIEFQLDSNIKTVIIYYNITFVWGGTLVEKEYTPGLRIQIPESYYKEKDTGKEYRYNVYKYVISEVSSEDNTCWGFIIDAERYDENNSGSGEVVPGGNTSGGENNPTKENGNTSNNVASHTCNFEWTIKVDPTTGADGLEEYKCTGCGIVKESHSIPASVAVIKDFYGNVKEAPENGSITYDSGKLYTISDYLLKKMAERKDVTVTIQFEYQGAKYELTFPAGTDYSAVLTDEEMMYGYFGVAAKLGLKVVAK